MQLCVDKITEISKAYTLGLTADELNALPGIVQVAAQGSFVGEVRVAYRLSRVARKISIEGEINCDLALQCSRCLTPLTQQLQEPFSLALNLVVDEETPGEELELSEELISRIQPLDGIIDLLPVLQEQVLMLLPTHPLCREDCLGLCPHCGVDHNLNLCACAPEPFNNRFGKLKNIKTVRS